MLSIYTNKKRNFYGICKSSITSSFTELIKCFVEDNEAQDQHKMKTKKKKLIRQNIIKITLLEMRGPRNGLTRRDAWRAKQPITHKANYAERAPVNIFLLQGINIRENKDFHLITARFQSERNFHHTHNPVSYK